MARQTQRVQREVLMKALFQIDVHGADARGLVGDLIRSAELDAAGAATVQTLFEAFTTHRATIDEALNDSASRWDLDRFSPVERAVLRTAVTEVWHGAVPVRVALDEAIELARIYGGPESPGFVNGLLDALFKKHGNL